MIAAAFARPGAESDQEKTSTPTGCESRAHKYLDALLGVRHVMRGDRPGINRRGFFLGQTHGDQVAASNMSWGVGIPPRHLQPSGPCFLQRPSGVSRDSCMQRSSSVLCWSAATMTASVLGSAA